jgi:NADH-quinone oxidoreductase subunit C
MTAQEIHEALKSRFGEAILEAKLEGVIDPFLRVAPDKIKEVSLFLRDDERLQFDLLMCLTAVDYTGGKLGVVYHLNSTTLNHKIVLKVLIANRLRKSGRPPTGTSGRPLISSGSFSMVIRTPGGS